MLTLQDLKNQGLILSQPEAQEIHHLISATSQGRGNGIILPGTGEAETPKVDHLKGYYAEIQKQNADLLKENAEFKDAANRTVGNYELIEKISELEKENTKLNERVIELELMPYNPPTIEKPKAGRPPNTTKGSSQTKA